MESELRQLWRGEVPLPRALIGYVIIYGFVINLLTSIAAMIAYSVTSSTMLLIVIHFAALPYNTLACVGAWRSVDRFKGSEALAILARVSIVGIFALLLLL